MISPRRGRCQLVYWRLHCSTRTLTVERLRLSKGTPAFRVTRLERTTSAGVPSAQDFTIGGPQHNASFTSALVLAPEAVASLRS